MAVKKKQKRLTQREKQFRAEVKREMQVEGILPPDKPKLNRKKFTDEAISEWNSRNTECYWPLYLLEAITYVISHKESRSARVSLEAVGAAKVLKVAMRLHEFSVKLQAEKRSQFKITEQYEFIKDILNA